MAQHQKQPKTQWRLKQHFYQSLRDPHIEQDMQAAEQALQQFAQRWRDTDAYLTDPTVLAQALAEYEELSAMRELEAPIRYAMFVSTLDAHNSRAHALQNQLSERLTKATNQVLFFEIALGALDVTTQQHLLQHASLQPYHYQLQNIFDAGQYQLSEPEERILSRKSLPARELWQDGLESAINKKTVIWQKQQLPLPAAMGKIPQLKTGQRRQLHNKLMTALADEQDFAASEITALYTDKKITDELRGYAQPYSATVMGNENTDESVEALVAAVSQRTRISKRFYALKRRLLGLETLQYADRNASIGTLQQTWSFKECYQYLKRVYADVNPAYAEMFERLVSDGQVDVYPKAGKGGGAFCAAGINQPTMVMLNHTDDLSSLMTFAHEMGHAVHFERSKVQPPRYQEATTTTAETASTLFEHLTFERVFETLSPKQQVIALHDKIQSDVATIFRQIACFNFELDMHRHVRERGAIDMDTIRALHNRHMQRYLGNHFSLTPDDGNFAIFWPHLRKYFYVYTYAYGALVSRAIAERWKQDASYAEQIDRFLSAGASASPEAIFADIGIDVRDPQFFVEGLNSINRDIGRLEKLVEQV